MTLIKFTAKRQEKETIGDSVIRAYTEIVANSVGLIRPQIVAVIPRMLSYFSTSPLRYEVTEVDIIVEVI